MNSKKCKMLRKMIYGDFSIRGNRAYTVYNNLSKGTNNGVTVSNHPDSMRSKYLKAKDRYKKRRQNN